MPRCAIYARFSTDRQSANSAEDQVADCTARAEREGWEIAGVYTDAAISGASNRRPGMTAMLADAKAGAFDIVVAEALDRIARNQADVATIYQALEFARVEIVTLSEGAINELHIGLKGTMGALFLKDLADKIRRGQRGTVERGRVPGGLTYGYDVVNRLGADGKLVRGLREINQEQASVIRRVYAEYIGGSSPKMIAKRLNADGIPSARGGEWRASAIIGSRARKIGLLHNPVYVGRYAYGRVHMKLDPDTRRRVSRANPADELLMVDMPHMRIISDELWQAVQDEVDARAMGPIHRQNRARYLLSGLMRCGGCSGAMIVVGDGRIGCARHREAGTCNVGQTIKRVEVEQRVLTGISDHLLGPDAVSLLVKTYHDEIEQQRADRRVDVDQIDRQIAAAERAIKRLVSAIAEGAADFRDVREALVARKAERDLLMRQREECQAVPVIALNPRVAEAYRKRVRQLASTYSRDDSREVLERLRDLIDGVRLTPLNAGGWDIEVHSSLGSAALLGLSSSSRGRSRPSFAMVAEEGLEPPTPGL